MSVTDRITEHLKKIDLRHGYMYLVARDLGYSAAKYLLQASPWFRQAGRKKTTRCPRWRLDR